jgi:hypothetical protein
MPEAIEAAYRARLAARRAAFAERERRSVLLSRTRLAIAGATVVAFAVWRTAGGWWYLAPVALFLLAAFVHARLLAARDRAGYAVAFYDRGLARLAGEWIGRGTSGETLRPQDHPYADDLDLFGRGGLFELLATTRTRAGEAALADWLLAPATPSDAMARQDAVRELAPLTDLREQLAVLGDGQGAGIHANILRDWATAPRRLPGRWPRLVLGALAAAVVTIPAWWLVADVVSRGTARAFVAVLAAEGLFALWFGRRVRASIHHADTSARDLELVSDLLRTIEQQSFSSAKLRGIQGELGGSDHPASAEIARLGQLVALLESRGNLMFALVAALLAWGTQLAFAIEAWRGRAGSHVPRWLEALGEFEALAAIATYAAEHPDHAFPEFGPPPAFLDATAIAHPLLPSTAVANDVRLGGGAATLLVVSGSNMSGKSTLLRALGINVVLAQAGAPVRASRLRLSPLAVGASIRVLDSLQDGKSRFYAEITRLKTIVDLTRAHDGAVLFLLDEILAGTNSHDRRLGADGLLGGLTRLGAVGLASTHDLALGEIADRLAPLAANVHFEDVFHDGILSFDYRLRPGLVRTSNAIALMRSVGLDV